MTENLEAEDRSFLSHNTVFSQDSIANTAQLEEVGTAILPGSTLANSSVTALKSANYNVTAAGSVENYTKWPLILEICEMKSGSMNVPMKNVMPGEKEGFASHKFGHRAAGTWVRITFRVEGGRSIHFMYSVPYNQDFHSNWLAVAACATSSPVDLNASKMYHNEYDMMDRNIYRNTVRATKVRNMGLCVVGHMGTSHTPDIAIQVYPEKFDELCKRVKEIYYKSEFAEGDYFRFLDEQFARDL